MSFAGIFLEETTTIYPPKAPHLQASFNTRNAKQGDGKYRKFMYQ